MRKKPFWDPQCEIRIRFCPWCGGETYYPGYRCIRCRKEAP